MKRLSIAMAMLLSAIMVVADNDVIIDGIKYTLDKNNSVSCKAVEKQRLVDVQIPSSMLTRLRLKGSANATRLDRLTFQIQSNT